MKCRGDPRGRPEFPNKGCSTFQPGALEWTRTTTPLGTGPQPAAYTIPPRGQIISFRMKFYTKPCSLSIPIDCWTGLLKSHFQLSIQACKHGRLRRQRRFFAVSAPFAFPSGRQKAQKLQKRIVQRLCLCTSLLLTALRNLAVHDFLPDPRPISVLILVTFLLILRL